MMPHRAVTRRSRHRRAVAGVTVIEVALALVVMSVLVVQSIPRIVAAHEAAQAQDLARIVEDVASAAMAYRTDESFLGAHYGEWPDNWDDIDGTDTTLPNYLGVIQRQITGVYELDAVMCTAGHDAPCVISMSMQMTDNPQRVAIRTAAALGARAILDPLNPNDVGFSIALPAMESSHDNFALLDGSRPFEGRVVFGAGECGGNDCVIIDPNPATPGDPVIELAAPLRSTDTAEFETLTATGRLTAAGGELLVENAVIDNLNARTFTYRPP